MSVKQTKKSGKFLDPKADIVFKKIFGQHPDLIKSFLNNLLPLPKGRFIESVKYLTPEQSPRIPGMKNTIVDVKCTDETGRIFIVEMQMTWSKSFLSRFLFGASKAYVQQLDRGQTYDTLCPVYGLALVNETFEESTHDWFHHYRLTNTKNLDKTLEGIELVFLELPKFNPKTLEYRKIGILWMRFLRETDGLESIPEEFKASPEVVKAMELAQESAYTRAELEAYDDYLDAVRVTQTVINDALEKGQQIGLEKGEQIGLEKGEQIGLEKGQKKLEEEKKIMARKMLDKGTSIKDISELTGFSIEVLQTFLP